MNFIELLKRRQSCREFSDKRVEREKLTLCVEAGRLAPSACNSQPWSFIVADTPEIVAEVAKCGQTNNSNQFLSQATAFIFVLEEFAQLKRSISSLIDNRYFTAGDIGAATVQICIEAEEQGLATCNIGLFDRPKLAEIFNLPREKHIAAMIAVGYAANKKVREKIRKPLEETVKYY